MNPYEWLSLGLILFGALFFAAGTAGLLRFPDVYSRLHALTKADNVGLGLIVAGLAVQAGSWPVTLRLVLVWVLVLLASATGCHLIARTALRSHVLPWRQR